MHKDLIVFTMIGCPHCISFKDMLKSNAINYIEYDIDEYKEEYDNFSKVVGNDYIPAFLIFESGGEGGENIKMFAPERDYNNHDEAISIIKDNMGLN